MTRSNAGLAGAAISAALAFAAIPNLDKLPILCGLDVENSSSDPLAITAQLASSHAASVKDDIVEITTWRDALPGAELHAEAMTHSPGHVHIAADTHLAGFPFSVWTMLRAVDHDLIDRIQAAATPAEAAEILAAHYGCA